MKNFMGIIGIVFMSMSASYGQNASLSGMSMEDISLQIIRLENQLQTLEFKRDSLMMEETKKELKTDQAIIVYDEFDCERCTYDKTSLYFNQSLPYITIVFSNYDIYTDKKTETRRIQYQGGNIKFSKDENYLEVFAPDSSAIKVLKEFEL